MNRKDFVNGGDKTSTCEACLHGTAQSYRGTKTGYYSCFFKSASILRAVGRLCDVGRFKPLSVEPVQKGL